MTHATLKDRDIIDIKKWKVIQALDLYGLEATKESIKFELENMLKKLMFRPVPVKMQKTIPKNQIFPSSLFLKDKDGRLK